MTLARIALELTNRCNLNCAHCLREVSEKPRDFPVALLGRVLREAREQYGIKQVTFTGGEPLLHPEFEAALAAAAANGFRVSMVTNGHLVAKRLALLAAPGVRESIGHVVVSFDGPDEEVHDRIRGAGAYRKAIAAVAALKGAGIPLGLKYTLGAHNLDRIESAVLGLAHLGPAFIEVSHLAPTPDNVRAGLFPGPGECRRAEGEVRRLAGELKVPVTLTAGAYSEQAFYGCASLCQVELYLDAGGRLGFCCVLPGLRGGAGDGREIIADLNEVSLLAAHERWIGAIAGSQRARLRRMAEGELSELDRFPCLACARSFGKLDWLGDFPDSPWLDGPRPGED